MKTASMVLAICLVGSLFAIGAHWRAERVRSAYRVRNLSDSLSLARNENEWLRGEIEKKRNPRALDLAMRRKKAGEFVRNVPVVSVVPQPRVEVPGL